MAPQLQAPSAILGRSESLPVSPTQKAAAVSGVTWRKKRSLRGPLRLRPRLVHHDGRRIASLGDPNSRAGLAVGGTMRSW